MYRISKVLNHNTILAVTNDDLNEYLIMEKGIGFGKKVCEYIEVSDDASLYSLTEMTKRGDARDMAKAISPIFLEIANEIINEVKKHFDNVDTNVLFPMADHLEYAVKRIKTHEYISNPLTEDIRVLFADEYKIALRIVPLIKKYLGIDIDEDEVGYVALHIHTSINKEDMSKAMKSAQALKDCVLYIEKSLNRKLDIHSLSYNRLVNHVRYMITRGLKGEEIKLNMNDYMELKFPNEFKIATNVCDKLAYDLGCNFGEVEIGYLAMHLQRVIADE